jgi:hypothetical protein
LCKFKGTLEPQLLGFNQKSITTHHSIYYIPKNKLIELIKIKTTMKNKLTNTINLRTERLGCNLLSIALKTLDYHLYPNTNQIQFSNSNKKENTCKRGGKQHGITCFICILKLQNNPASVK